MNRFKAFALASCLGVASIAFAPLAKADEWNKKTILTVNETITIPGGANTATLAPGKYVMKLVDSPANRHIVQVFNEDETKLITTILAIPNYRLQPTGDTQFGFWETPAGQPRALRSWFYPGDNFGQEFVYPKEQAVAIARITHERVPTTTATDQSQMATAKVSTVDQTGTEYQLEQPQQMAKNTPPPATTQENEANRAAQTPTTPAPATQTPAQTAAPERTTLPHTASPYPLIGLIGLVSLGLGIVARKAASRA